jgi:putative membrane protein
MFRALLIGASLLAVNAAAAQTATESPEVAAASTITDPQQFADMASSSNMFEIESSRLALEKSKNEQVTTFAQHMIDDHTKAGEDMTAAAQSDGLTVAPGLQPAHQSKLDELSGAEGDAFDQAYIAAQVAAHDEAVALFQSFSTGGEDSALKAFAANTLPTLQKHREEVGSLAGE